MSKVIYWIIGIIIVVGGIYLIATHSGSMGMDANATTTPSSMTSGSDTSTASNGTPQTLAGLLSMSAPAECSFTDASGSTTVDGVVYVSGGKLRADVTTNVSGKAMQSHILGDTNNFYAWLEGNSQGVKFAMSGPAGSAPSGQSLDVQKKLNYKCQSWNPTSDTFNLPSGVTFTDTTKGVPTTVH